MKIDVKKSCHEVGREQWNYLVSQNATNTIFQTYEWHCAFEAAYSGGHNGYILCGIEENILVGVAPFCICKIKKENVIRFLGYERADYCDFIYLEQKKRFIPEVFSFLKANSSEWDRIELKNIPEHSPTCKLISAACASFHLISYQGKRIPCPALLLKDKDRPYKKLVEKKSLVRHYKYFLNKKNFRVSHIVGKEQIAMHLQAFFDQHIAKWSTTGFPSLFLISCHQDFYRNLVKELGKSGWILFTEVYSNDNPIAFHFGFVYQGKLVWYKPTFDILLSKQSPGEALLKVLMLFVEIEGLDELDFTIGDEAFKRRFSNIIRYNVTLDIFINPLKYVKYGIRCLLYEILSKLLLGFHRMVPSIFDKAKRIKMRSLSGGKKAALKFVLFRCSKIIIISRKEVQQADLEEESCKRLFQIRQGQLEDVIHFYKYLTEIKRHQAIGDAVKRFKNGDVLLGAVQNGEMAGIVWVIAKNTIELSAMAHRFGMPQQSILITSFHAASKFPISFVFLALLKAIFQWFPDKTRICYCVENRITLHPEIKRLFKDSKIIRWVSLFGIRFRF